VAEALQAASNMLESMKDSYLGLVPSREVHSAVGTVLRGCQGDLARHLSIREMPTAIKKCTPLCPRHYEMLAENSCNSLLTEIKLTLR
jgi:hypothetical protein